MVVVAGSTRDAAGSTAEHTATDQPAAASTASLSILVVLLPTVGSTDLEEGNSLLLLEEQGIIG